MKAITSRLAAALLLGITLFATSCEKKTEIPVTKPELKGVGISVAPMTLEEWNSPILGSSATRATAQSERQREIHFAAGDMIYVEGIQYDQAHNPIASCVGNLTMDNGDGGKEATFSGQLYAPEGSSLDDFQDITYYLVGANDKRTKLVDIPGTNVKGIDLPLGDNHIVASFTEAIEKYSDIGFCAPKFTDQVKLIQGNSYFIFNIIFPSADAFSDVADIKTTFVHPDGTTLEVTTEETPAGFKLNDSGCLLMVVPCEIEGEKIKVSDIQLVVNLKNGKSIEKSFPSTNAAGNTVERSRVYILEFTYESGDSTSQYWGEDNNPWQ